VVDHCIVQKKKQWRRNRAMKVVVKTPKRHEELRNFVVSTLKPWFIELIIQ
jgi:hypothetical protein